MNFPGSVHDLFYVCQKGITRTLPLCTGIMASISSLSQYTVRSHFLTTRTQMGLFMCTYGLYTEPYLRKMSITAAIIVYAQTGGEVIFTTLTARNQLKCGYSPSLLSLFS